MGISANFSAMNQAIMDYIRANIPQDPNKAHIGTVSGNRVIIGEKSYDFIPTVDLYFGDNSRVACILPEHSSSAVVVGVF